MTFDNPWTQFGGEFRKWTPPTENKTLPIDPIEFAGMILLYNVISGFGPLLKQMNWLTTLVGILRDREVYLKEVQPKSIPVLTSNRSTRDVLKQLRYEYRVLRDALKNQQAWGRLYLVPKYDCGIPTGMGRTILDLSQFSKLCARPRPVNLPFIPGLLRRIGSYRFERCFMWCADWKNFFHQIPIGDHMAPFFTVKAEGFDTFQFAVLPQGWSWSPSIATAISYGIALGEWPSDLKYMIEWETLAGDANPA